MSGLYRLTSCMVSSVGMIENTMVEGFLHCCAEADPARAIPAASAAAPNAMPFSPNIFHPPLTRPLAAVFAYSRVCAVLSGRHATRSRLASLRHSARVGGAQERVLRPDEVAAALALERL